MKIVVIANNFPTIYSATSGTFIEQTVKGLLDKGIAVEVIVPISIHEKIRAKRYSNMEFREYKNYVYKVHTPSYISLSNKKMFNSDTLNTAHITYYSYKLATSKVLTSILKKDIINHIYGHFLYPSGFVSGELGVKYGISSFCIVGEGKSRTIEALGIENSKKKIRSIDTIIPVSKWVADMLVEYKIRAIEDINNNILPNATDLNKFHYRTNQNISENLGLCKNDFIVIFVGRFIRDKGIEKVIQSAKLLKDVKFIFIGSGPIVPNVNGNIIFSDSVLSSELPEYLSAANLFVLPTKFEGSCNSIIEALAVGLPVISSNLSFNYELLTDKNSIMINPDSIEELVNAIRKFKENENYYTAVKKQIKSDRNRLSIETRIEKLIKIINKEVESENIN